MNRDHPVLLMTAFDRLYVCITLPLLNHFLITFFSFDI